MANQTEERQKNKDLICQVARTGKFLDFSNGLTLAALDDYAQLTGRGGKHGINAVIKVDITDYKNKDKSGSIKCTATMEPYIFEILKSVALRNVGTNNIASSGTNTLLDFLSSIETHTESLAAALTGFNITIREACYELSYGKGLTEAVKKLGLGTMSSFALARKFKTRQSTFTSGEFINGVSGSDRATSFAMLNSLAACSPQDEMRVFGRSYPVTPCDVRAVNNYTDFEKKITRVHDRKLTPDGYATVKETMLRRQRFYTGRDGSRQDLESPWYISITTFEAKPLETGIGYVKGTERNQKSAFINITDEEVIEICYHVENFVRVWQNAMCIPVVAQGIQIKEQERIQRLQENNQGYSQSVGAMPGSGYYTPSFAPAYNAEYPN